jgi:hypothetical protein
VDNFRHTDLTSTYVNGFDSNGTLTAQSLSKAHRKPLRGVACGVLVAIGIALCSSPDAGSAPVKKYITYKEYAYYALGYNLKEYKCLVTLYGKESAWNPKARNGSHYGIPQGRSIYLSKVDGYKQIQWGLKYIQHHRIYQGDTCKALQHWKDKGWH